MKNFLYKLIFPYCNKLYVGKASNKNRYGTKNKPGEKFIGPHHNVEVQKLLDNGEFCFFYVVKEFETTEEVNFAEDTYLKKVWKSDDWVSRPSWLMNRNRNSVGFMSGSSNPVHNLSLEQQQERVKPMQTPEAREKASASFRETVGRLEVHWNKGRHRPDMEKPQTQKQKDAARKNGLRKIQCPHCELKTNPGNLAQHIKRKH